MPKKKSRQINPLDFFKKLVWLDKRPLLELVEPYRRKIFTDVLFTFDELDRLFYTLALLLRAKKNWKSADLIFAALFFLFTRKALGGVTCLTVATDEDQAGFDVDLAKKIIRVNPILADEVHIREKSIVRKDGDGILEIRPGKDFQGQHGGKFDFLGIDEIHTQRDWNLLEALQPDPTRQCLTWITSYNSIHHKPGVPLFDLLKIGWEKSDPRMYLSYYAADKTTDPDFENASPEDRANPSRASWEDQNYLEQQRRRLPTHKFRRLHQNLPGSPEGAAFSAEKVMDAVERGVKVGPPKPDLNYFAFVDMSGGSSDDATLAIAHLEDRDGEQVAVLDLITDQGQRPPFDPGAAVQRFAGIMKTYRCYDAILDRYAGLTFQFGFEQHGIGTMVSELTKSELYQAMEPKLNAGGVVLLDHPETESQFLGLVWRGNKIDHASGVNEHDDFSNSVAGAVWRVFNQTHYGDDLGISIGGPRTWMEDIAAGPTDYFYLRNRRPEDF